MTTEDRNIKLKHLITCMKCEVSGKVCDENCPTQYEAGNIGEIIENLEAISEILEQQPCEDAVSRQAVKRKLQEHHDLFINAYGGRVGFKFMADAKEKARVDEINNCIAMIVNEPSVTPKEKTGHWIDEADEIDALFERHVYKCSECGRIANYYVGGYESWWDIYIPNYCPNCGARMVSE